MNKAYKATFLGAAFALTFGGLALAAPAAHAATVPFTTTTQVSNNGAHSFKVSAITPTVMFTSISTAWAIDSFTRTSVVDSTDAQQCIANVPGFVSGTDNCWQETISDAGTFKTIAGALQPNQGVGVYTGRTLSNIVTGNFSGTATYLFYAPVSIQPSSSLIPASMDEANAVDNVLTNNWPAQSLTGTTSYGAGEAGRILNSWSWQYGSNACANDVWTLSYADNYGQSSNLADDGNITGNSCTPPPPPPTPTPPVTITFGTYGNNVNKFGNGFDVFRQHAAYNTPIVGWPATQHDPATHFLKEAEGSYYRFEYAPNGTGDGLCVSNPGNGLLVLRDCNANVWQEFSYSGGHVISAFGGGIINPDGTGAQLTAGSSATPWGGSNYTWTAFSSLPA